MWLAGATSKFPLRFFSAIRRFGSLCTSGRPYEFATIALLPSGAHDALYVHWQVAMSYQVLARKWRPRIFREMVGQEHVLKALINALDRGQLHHAYLFTGTRGVGKTTIARIFAKCLNCDLGVSSEPCGQCPSCTEIAEGRFVDLIEVDAASRTKVEDTRELLENVQYAPTRGRYKVYLIDEVHMLSTHSFNALLKTLEEPPPHVKFLLATTDPQKLPATILSRCLQFHLKNMTPERIVGHLRFVLEQERVSFEEGGLWQLARAADGSMRDAMSLTDQAIAYGCGTLSDEDVSAMLGTLDRGVVQQLLQAVVSGEGPAVLAAVARLSEHSPDYEAALGDLQRLLHRIALVQAVPEALDNGDGDEDAIRALAAVLTGEDVQLYYQVALQARRDFPFAPDPRSALEMALLRMLTFRPEGVLSPPSAPRGGDRSGANKPMAPVAALASTLSAPAPVSVPEPAVVAQPSLSALEPERVTSAPELGPVALEPPALAMAPEVDDEPSPQQGFADMPEAPPIQSESDYFDQPPMMAAPAPMATSAGHGVAIANEPSPVLVPVAPLIPPAQPELPPLPASDALEALDNNDWLAIFPRLDLVGVARSVVSFCVLVSVNGGKFNFVLDQRNSALFNPGHSEKLADSLGRLFGRSLPVVVEPGEVGALESPAAQSARRVAERQAAALALVRADENVQMLMSRFGATLLEDTVKPH